MASEKNVLRFLAWREKKIRLARKNFWEFCKILHGYKEEWTHLKIMCDTLQKFFENNLTNENGYVYSKLMINMPPRFYKTRTMILFCCWLLGKNNKNTIISTSYSDDLATEFSRYTRDEISRNKNNETDIAYSDIFPKTKIKDGDASAKKWALQGQHFTYLGAGFGASITGKGCSVSIIDDQIKNYEDACNEDQLQKKWEWYTNTFISRFEENAKEIIVMTRWSDGDICGRILADETESPKWRVLKMEAMNEDSGEMLCSDMLSKESYDNKKRLLGDDVFNANYHQRTINKKGALYQKYLEYDKLPEKDGKPIFDRLICYTDTADEGSDYLVSICGIELNKICYILDTVCTQEPQEKTEDYVVDMIIKNEIKDITIESNNGGRAFARNVDRKLKEKKYYKCQVKWFHQTENKMARIMSNASNVESRIIYPKGWSYRWPVFSKLVKSFQRTNKNKHDDVPDCLTGIIEMMDNKHVIGSSGISAGMMGL